MNRLTKIMAGVVALGAVAIPAAVVVPALASDSPAATTTTTMPTTPPATGQTGAGAAAGRLGKGQGARKLLRRAAVNKVSAQLGISPDTLKAAVKDARTNHKPAQPFTDPTARRQYWLGQIADELHITPDHLQAAVKAARQEIRTELLGN